MLGQASQAMRAHRYVLVQAVRETRLKGQEALAHLVLEHACGPLRQEEDALRAEAATSRKTALCVHKAPLYKTRTR